MTRYKDTEGIVYEIVPRGTHPFKVYEFWSRDRGQMCRLDLKPVNEDREKAEKKLAKFAAKRGLEVVGRYD